MNLLPPPSRRVLIDLAACLPAPADGGGEASPVQRAFVELTALLSAQEAAWTVTDHILADLTAEVGLPRVALPVAPGAPAAYAADAGTIRTRVGPGPAARRSTATLRRRQRQYPAAAEAAGLPAAEARDRTLTIALTANPKARVSRSGQPCSARLTVSLARDGFAHIARPQFAHAAKPASDETAGLYAAEPDGSTRPCGALCSCSI